MRIRTNCSSISMELCEECAPPESNPERDDSRPVAIRMGMTTRSEAREIQKKKPPPVSGLGRRKCSKCKAWIGKPHFQLQVLGGRLAEPLKRSVQLKPGVWKNLPQECLEVVLARLPLGSRVRFSVVSKAWQSLLASPDFKRLCDSVQAPSALPVCCLQYQLGELNPSPAKARGSEVVKVGLSFLPPKFRAFRPSDYVVQDGLICIFKPVKEKKPEKVEGAIQHPQISVARKSGAGMWGGGEDEDDDDDDDDDDEDDDEEDDEDEDKERAQIPPRPPHPYQRGHSTPHDDDEDEGMFDEDSDEDMFDEDSDEDMFDGYSDEDMFDGYSDEDMFDEDSDYDSEEDRFWGSGYHDHGEDDEYDCYDSDDPFYEEEEKEDDYYGHCVRKHFAYYEQPGFRCDRSVVCSSGDVVGMSFCVANPIMRTFTELPVEFGKQDDFDDRRACWRLQLEVDASGDFTVIVLCQRKSEPTVSIYRSRDNRWESTSLTQQGHWFTQSFRYDDDSSHMPQYVLCNGELLSFWHNSYMIHSLKSGQKIWDSRYQDRKASYEDEEDEDKRPRVICKVFEWRGRIFCLEQDYEERKVDFGVWELERSPYIWQKVSCVPEHLQKMLKEPGRSSKLTRRHITATFSSDTMYFRMGTGKPDDRICMHLCRHLVAYNILDDTWSVIRDGGLAFNCMVYHLFQPNGICA